MDLERTLEANSSEVELHLKRKEDCLHDDIEQCEPLELDICERSKEREKKAQVRLRTVPKILPLNREEKLLFFDKATFLTRLLEF